jgi:hypothetical protein
VAEQNSVDLAWALLMEDDFKDLRNVIYATEEERKRFRQLVVNGKFKIQYGLSAGFGLGSLCWYLASSTAVVLATDIVDAELKQLRNGRWAKAFNGEQPKSEEEATAAVNRKATIVLEHRKCFANWISRNLKDAWHSHRPM